MLIVYKKCNLTNLNYYTNIQIKQLISDLIGQETLPQKYYYTRYALFYLTRVSSLIMDKNKQYLDNIIFTFYGRIWDWQASVIPTVCGNANGLEG